MFKIKFNKTDLAKSLVVPNGWQVFKIEKFTHKKSGDGDSFLYVYDLILMDGEKEDTLGRSQTHNFSSKAPGMMAPFIAALAEKTVKEVLEEMEGETLDFDAETPVGELIGAKVAPKEYQGRNLAQIVDWCPFDQIPE